METKTLPKEKRVVTIDTINNSFQTIIEQLTVEFKNEKDKGRSENIKNLRRYIKQLEQLQSDVKKITKQKKVCNNQNSGFMKPVKISNDLANFLDLPVGSYISRAQCNKKIQEYIISKKLQNQSYKREILPDKSLTQLLRYNPEMHGPLYYTVIQKLIQVHFEKN